MTKQHDLTNGNTPADFFATKIKLLINCTLLAIWFGGICFFMSESHIIVALMTFVFVFLFFFQGLINSSNQSFIGESHEDHDHILDSDVLNEYENTPVLAACLRLAVLSDLAQNNIQFDLSRFNKPTLHFKISIKD